MSRFFRRQANWKELWFYQKSVVLFRMTSVYINRFFPRFGDRTVDQMLQAARSGKQNIVEGSVDGVTSMEMEIKLLNVARASIQELREDYEDYLGTRGLTQWKAGHPRYDGMLEFCRSHNKIEEYLPFFDKWSDEEMANVGKTLAHMIDRMIVSYRAKLEKEFLEQGGLKECMWRACTGQLKNNKKTF